MDTHNVCHEEGADHIPRDAHHTERQEAYGRFANTAQFVHLPILRTEEDNAETASISDALMTTSGPTAESQQKAGSQ